MSGGAKGSLLLAWQVKNKPCLVVGGGNVAVSRIHHLVRAQADITVISGEGNIDDEILAFHEKGQIRLFQRNYRASDLTMYQTELAPSLLTIDLENITADIYSLVDSRELQKFATVCVCIDDYDLSLKIYYQCKLLQLPVNIADKPQYCDFYFGSMYNRDSLQIMVSTNGKSPRLSRIVKDTIAKQFDNVDLNKAVENLGLIRSSLRTLVSLNDLQSIDVRMNWIKDLTDFFSLQQWSELDLSNNVSVEKIIQFFPNYPPSNYEEFQKAITP